MKLLGKHAKSLSADDMRQAMERIMSGGMPPSEIATFLKSLAERGETADELAAAVEVLRAHVVALPLPPGLELIDTCGTGGDQQGTCNISTLAALTVAACSIPVAKHGNRAASSRCGSADVLEALGVNLDATPEQVARSITETGFGFCFAPRFHPAMKVVAPVRKELGIRTIFNLIGPLANPARLTYQILGVSDPTLLMPMAQAMQRLGIKHGLVVHGSDGLDEATTTGDTEGIEVRPNGLELFRVRPEDFGLSRVTIEDLRGGDAQENARITREILSGMPSKRADVVALNAGLAVYIADRAYSMQEGVVKAESALRSGRVQTLLDRVVELSKQ